MILLGEHVPDLAGDSVAIDYEAASLQMTEHLLTIDRQIAVIGIQRNLAVDASRLRAAGFDAAWPRRLSTRWASRTLRWMPSPETKARAMG